MEDAGAESGGAGGWEKWTAASVIQLGIGIYSYRKVRSGECRLMPLKAFGIASLFVGAGFTSLVAVISANGIHSVHLYLSFRIFGISIDHTIGYNFILFDNINLRAHAHM